MHEASCRHTQDKCLGCGGRRTRGTLLGHMEACGDMQAIGMGRVERGGGEAPVLRGTFSPFGWRGHGMGGEERSIDRLVFYVKFPWPCHLRVVLVVSATEEQ